jgi:hypothetical protein
MRGALSTEKLDGHGPDKSAKRVFALNIPAIHVFIMCQ